MRTTLLTVGLAAWLGPGCSPSPTPSQLVGTWEGEGAHVASARATFTDQATCELVLVSRDGVTRAVTGDYEVDFSKSPVPLSIRNIPGVYHPMHTILQFEGPHTLRVGTFAPKWRLRPVSFDRRTQIVLHRSAP